MWRLESERGEGYADIVEHITIRQEEKLKILAHITVDSFPVTGQKPSHDTRGKEEIAAATMEIFTSSFARILEDS